MTSAYIWGFYQPQPRCIPTKWHVSFDGVTIPCGYDATEAPQELQSIVGRRPPRNRYKLGICQRCLAAVKHR